MRIHLTLKSSNKKTGPIPVSTTSAESCPTSCPLIKSCYAKSGPLAIHWQQVTQEKRGTDVDAFCSEIENLPDNTLWRHNQAGDLLGDKEYIDATALQKLVNANNSKKGFTYTHYDVVNNTHNRDLVHQANQKGFTINLSGNNTEHADVLKSLGAGPVVTLLPEKPVTNTFKTNKGNTVVVCPATYKENVNCASCRLCAWKDRQVIIGFPVHGSNKKQYTNEVNQQ